MSMPLLQSSSSLARLVLISEPHFPSLLRRQHASGRHGSLAGVVHRPIATYAAWCVPQSSSPHLPPFRRLAALRETGADAAHLQGSPRKKAIS